MVKLFKLKFIIISILLILKFDLISSSHFFGGSISSRPIQDDNSTVLMEFTIRFAYRRDFTTSQGVFITWCNQTTIDDRALFGPAASILCRKNCLRSNEVIGTTSIYCVAFSEQDNWSYGYKTFVKIFNKKIKQISYKFKKIYFINKGV
jgi:hypothetical protein